MKVRLFFFLFIFLILWKQREFAFTLSLVIFTALLFSQHYCSVWLCSRSHWSVFFSSFLFSLKGVTSGGGGGGGVGGGGVMPGSSLWACGHGWVKSSFSQMQTRSQKLEKDSRTDNFKTFRSSIGKRGQMASVGATVAWVWTQVTSIYLFNVYA